MAKKSRATYIPNKNIQSLNVKNGKKLTEIKNKDILDGAYVRKGVKFEDGGNTRGWVNYDKSHLINTETGMIVSKGTDLKNIKPKDIKGFEKLGVSKYAKGGSMYRNGGDVNNPSKKEMLDYLNMYFDYYDELRTIAIEEDNILTRKMLNSLDDEELEMAYDDAKYEIKADTYAKGGSMKVGDKKVYNKLVGRKGNEYYFLDYVFKHENDFMGAVGTVVTPVDSNYFEYATSRDGLAERYLDAMSESEWCNTLGLDEDDCTEEEIIDGIENLYRVGELQPFEECSSNEESQMREIAEFSDSNKYPLFEVIGGGRSFDKNNKFDEVYDKSLLALIIKAESNKLANGGNMNDDKSYICTYEIGGL